jgi:hypothetical protein
LRIVSELKARRIDLPIIVIGKSRGNVGLAVQGDEGGRNRLAGGPPAKRPKFSLLSRRH